MGPDQPPKTWQTEVKNMGAGLELHLQAADVRAYVTGRVALGEDGLAGLRHAVVHKPKLFPGREVLDGACGRPERLCGVGAEAGRLGLRRPHRESGRRLVLVWKRKRQICQRLR